MRRLLLILAATTTLAAAGHAAPTRLRGTITAVSPGLIMLHTQDGTDVDVMLDQAAHYVAVTKSDEAAIKPGTFIGTATKGAGSRLTSLEVVVFPPEMRGTGEGHYDWDKLPDPAGGSAVASSMTNGTVAAGHAPSVPTKMTNGNIEAATATAGALHLTVSYKGGQKTIVVPPGTPVVALRPADQAILKVGAHAFVIAEQAGSSLTGKAVMVGQDGLVPPM